jgi:hypothetical protein
MIAWWRSAEPEEHRARLPSCREEKPRLDVVGAPERVTLAQLELPGVLARDPVLQRRDMDVERLVDVDRDLLVGPLGGRRSQLHQDGGHAARPSRAGARET